MVRQDGTAGIVGLRYANPTYPNFPPHPLPSPYFPLNAGNRGEGSIRLFSYQ